MSMKDDGGPAFPSLTEVEQYDSERGKYVSHHLPMGGMSLRDYFAGQALSGMVSCGQGWPRLDDGPEIAKRAFQIADAMLAERNKS